MSFINRYNFWSFSNWLMQNFMNYFRFSNKTRHSRRKLIIFIVPELWCWLYLILWILFCNGESFKFVSRQEAFVFNLDHFLFWSILVRAVALFESGACKVVGGLRWRRRWRWMHTRVTWTVATSLVTLAYWRPALIIPAFHSPLVTLGSHRKLSI